jgi:hypothetical protein
MATGVCSRMAPPPASSFRINGGMVEIVMSENPETSRLEWIRIA